jgi:hypothetical protein
MTEKLAPRLYDMRTVRLALLSSRARLAIMRLLEMQAFATLGEIWLRGLDSNQDNQLQRLACYQLHYPGMGKKSVADLASICYSHKPQYFDVNQEGVGCAGFLFATGGKFLKKCSQAGPDGIVAAVLSRFCAPHVHPKARERSPDAARHSEHVRPLQESSLDPCRRFDSSLAQRSPDAPYFL